MDNNPPQDNPQAMLDRLKQQAQPLATQALERARQTWGPLTQEAPDSPLKAQSDHRLMQMPDPELARELLTPEQISKLGISPEVLSNPEPFSTAEVLNRQREAIRNSPVVLGNLAMP